MYVNISRIKLKTRENFRASANTNIKGTRHAISVKMSRDWSLHRVFPIDPALEG